MSDTLIDISIRETAFDQETRRLAPGEVVQGTVRITPEKDINCRHLFARLQWRTEGRGDEDKAIVAEQDLYQGTLSAGMPRHHSFHLRLPDQPWSYVGQLIRIVWEVEVSIDVAFARDPRAAVQFAMRPGVS